ncbi:MAG: T9SS type A sorting domain-containing protein [Bacteroidota bacterium]
MPRAKAALFSPDYFLSYSYFKVRKDFGYIVIENYKMRKIVTLFLINCSVLLVNAQRHDNNWLWGVFTSYQDSSQYFLGNAQGDFNNDSITVYSKFHNMPFDASVGYFSNADGELLIYTNGMQIRDTTGNLIEKGDSINHDVWWDLNYQNMMDGFYGFPSAREAILFYQPGNDSTIFMIHEHPSSTDLFDNKIKLTKIAASRDGTFSVTKKNIVISQYAPSFQNTAACKHGNGRDWWVLFTDVNTNCVVKLLITDDTLIEYDRQCIGDTIEAGWGCKATFSLDGTKFSSSDAQKNGTNIFDFDRCSGRLSNPQHIPPIVKYDSLGFIGSDVNSVDFSPDNQFMYVFLGELILQFDLESPQFPNDFDTIVGWDTFIDTGVNSVPFVYFSSSYGPDGKLYIGPAGGQRFLCTINNPNGKGAACDFRMRNIQLPKVWSYTSPNIPNYRLGRLPGSACDTIYSDIKPIYTQTPWLKVYPNPATDVVRFEYNWVEWDAVGDCQLVLADLQGRVVLSQTIPKYSSRQEVNIKELAAGVYTASVQSGEKRIAVCKVVKE